jgi:transketolase
VLRGTGAGNGIERGGYVIEKEQGGEPDIVLVATGSEVAVALEAARILREQRRVRTRVVSLPCWELFDEQPAEYRDQVLPPAVTRRVAVEAASPFGWERYVGSGGRIIALDRFGASAPEKRLAEEFGFTGAAVAAAAATLL